jgi:hypothetical protein
MIAHRRQIEMKHTSEQDYRSAVIWQDFVQLFFFQREAEGGLSPASSWTEKEKGVVKTDFESKSLVPTLSSFEFIFHSVS